MTARLPDHLDLIASAPDGIRKLRGLILELAVRGKLVAQDPDDEPASELLKRIAQERARLEGDGTCKKSKQVPPLGKHEEPFGVPERWTWTRFEFVFSLEYGDNLPAPKRTNSGEFPVYGSNGVVGTHSECSVRKPCVVVGRKGSAGALNLCLHTGCWVTDVAYYCIPPAEIDLEFCFKLFHTLGLDSLGKGIKPGLSRSEANAIPVPIPPLPEQHRIVAKVDELMALCDRLEAEQADAESAQARLVGTLLATLTRSTGAADLAANWQRLAEHFDTLFTTESSLDALKQTILQLAVMGKLVPQDPNDEPASELLKRIAKERARLEAEGVSKRSKPLPPAAGERLYTLPKSWQWSTLNPLVRVMDSGWSPACIETPSPSHDVWGVLKTTAVQTFQYVECENKELPGHLKPRPECEVAAGDILITRAGPKNRVAISCLVEATRPRLMISDKIIRFHLVEGGMYEKFVALCLNAGATAAYLESAKSGMAASQMNITQEKLRAVPIPICSTAEQHRIVAKVDELLALVDGLKADLAESRARQERLAATLIDTALAAA